MTLRTIQGFFGAKALVACLLYVGTAALRAQVNPPPPPANGPGCTNYPHAGLEVTKFGSDAGAYWVFEPRSPQPASAPLIVFSHGYFSVDPTHYEAWIEHIVRRGNLVVYPQYQSFLGLPPPAAYLTNTVTAVKAAILWLQSNGLRVQPQLDKFAVVGHSTGGLLAANLAAVAAGSGLPPVRAAMCCQPGLSWGSPFTLVPLEDMSLIPPNTLLLAIAGAEDTLVYDVDARKIYEQSINVPTTNKDFLLMRSDTHGAAPLISTHYAACASTDSSFPPDTLDYFCFWKLFDALCDAAFYGTNRDYALGGTPQQCFMGNWSDGQPVNPLVSASQATPLKLLVEKPNVVVSWVPAMSNFLLQSSTTLPSRAAWQTVPNVPPPANGQYSITLPFSGTNLFFRLAPQ